MIKKLSQKMFSVGKKYCLIKVENRREKVRIEDRSRRFSTGMSSRKRKQRTQRGRNNDPIQENTKEQKDVCFQIERAEYAAQRVKICREAHGIHKLGSRRTP